MAPPMGSKDFLNQGEDDQMVIFRSVVCEILFKDTVVHGKVKLTLTSDS
jgi:hypothetical protein